MRRVFVDTSYYVALLSARDEHHQSAKEQTAQFGGHFVTTAWVLTELANRLADARSRAMFLALFADLKNDPRVTIIPPSQDLFDRAMNLYAHRLDKDWSLTDCASFVVMEQEKLTEALTADHHFEQAGFTILLK